VPFTVKVLDFGIAKAVADNATAAKVSRTIGSPLWMAPEQAQLGARLTPATDVWPLGLIVFYLLTGKYYWRAPNAGAGDLMMVLNEVMLMPLDAASSRAAEYGVATALPAGFDGWFARCVDRDATRRWPHAGGAWEALEAVLGRSTTAVAATVGQGTQAVSMVPAAPSGIAAQTQAWQSTVSTPVAMPVQAVSARPAWVVPGVVAAVVLVGIGASLAMSRSTEAPTASTALASVTSGSGASLPSRVEHHTSAEAQQVAVRPTPAVAAPVVVAPTVAAPVMAPRAVPRDPPTRVASQPVAAVRPRRFGGAPGGAPGGSSNIDALLNRAVGGGTPARPAAAAERPGASTPPSGPSDADNLPERLSRQQITSVMARLSPAVRRCAGSRSGTVPVTVTIGSDGVPQTVGLTGIFAGTPEGACMERVVSGARFARFRAPTFTVSYPYVIQPTARPSNTGGGDFGDLGM